jgi:hypothetical protein
VLENARHGLARSASNGPIAGPSGNGAFALVKTARDRYAKLVPSRTPQEAVHEAIEKPVIRIAVQRPPDSVVIDTDQPTAGPSLMPPESAIPDVQSPLQAYAPVDLSPVTAVVDRKKPKYLKRQRAKVATYQSPSGRLHVVDQWGPSSTCSADQTILSRYCLRSGKKPVQPALNLGFRRDDDRWNRPVHRL